MMRLYAIVPDQSGQPAALFIVPEDAIAWGLAKFGVDAFRVQRLDVVLLTGKERCRHVGTA